MPFCRRLTRFRRESAISFSHKLLIEVALLLSERVSMFLSRKKDEGVNVLVLGCRDGRVADELQPFLSQADKVYQCDVSPSILSSTNGACCIVADDEALPFRERSFDFLVSNLTLHNINDLVMVLTRFRSLLRPGGLFFAATFGNATLRDVKKAVIKTEGERIVARIQPFNYVSEWPMLLRKCGFQDIVVDVNLIEVSYDSLYHLFKDLKSMGEGNTFRKLYEPIGRRALDRAWDIYKESVGWKTEGPVPVCFEIAILKGNNKPWCP
ncbi:hypothetical protein ANPL_02375 [Anaplasma platys]|uniref:Methyltransferase type 11 domain-containing protein n=1 Tax=Anaplasma platys TaxID=949 RepID=A0A858PYA0_9RICK|nr:methyltransferase domain-containing protein [Anaplasma platys]QJC27542.1 hypothetical protein ANPL_02375 [Anaplasma platys]